MSTVYLAWSSAANETLIRHAGDEPVALLVAYPVLKDFLKVRKQFNVRQWCVDSGAFSAYHSGVKIDLQAYIEACKEALSFPDVPAVEVFGLDVIGDADAGRRNLERMWEAGVPAIPTWHGGEPWEFLTWAAANSEKVAISGSGSPTEKSKQWYMRQAFARVWPKKIHGFAMASPKMLNLAPFHSVDASSWIYAPAAMGMWAGYTGKQMRVGSRTNRDFWIEVVEHQKRERWARWRWRRELGGLGTELRNTLLRTSGSGSTSAS